MKYFVSEKKRIFADISLKEVIEKAKNSNSVTKEVECKRIQTRRFTCARLACGKDRRGWSYTPTLPVARIGGADLSVAEQWSAKARNPG